MRIIISNLVKKIYWEDHGMMHEIDCNRDCGKWPFASPEASVKY